MKASALSFGRGCGRRRGEAGQDGGGGEQADKGGGAAEPAGPPPGALRGAERPRREAEQHESRADHEHP